AAQAIVLATLVVASWVWPLVMFRGSSSEAVHLDEGFLVIMAVVIPAPAVVVAFAGAIIVAQFVRRRPRFKSVFNFGQVLTGVGASLLVFHVIAGSFSQASPRVLIAAAFAAA